MKLCGNPKTSTQDMLQKTALLSIVFCSSINAFLFEGDECIVHGTRVPGICIVLDKCQYAKKALERNGNPHFCGFAGKTPLVCCPKSISAEMCIEYYDKKKQVYAIDLGQKASVKEFPHMAAIGYGDNVTSLLWLCGGSLISHHFVMTAAHCVRSKEYGPARYVRLGDLDLKNTTEDASPVDFAIAETFVHPMYKSSSHYHDIALFKLAKYIYFWVYFHPACLHSEKEIPVVTLEAAGWGKLGLFGESSSHLMKVNLTLVDHGTCARRYADVAVGKLKSGILDESQMCAGDSVGRDTCPGDSGGPLHYRQERTDLMVDYFVVAGITSFGKGCGGQNSIGVYTRVSAYVDWIENIVWPET